MKSRVHSRIPKMVGRDLRHLATQIREVRIARGLTQADVARRLEISPVTVRAVERGDPTVTVGIWMTVLWLLGIVAVPDIATQLHTRGSTSKGSRQRARAPAKPLDDF